MEVSACVIVKNEEKNLRRCLDSVKSIVSEFIVVDTGSTDGTVDVALSYEAKVFHYQWDNNFSNARNYAISKANGTWIIFLDADEFLSDDTTKILPQIIRKAQKAKADAIVGYMLQSDNSGKSINRSHLTIRVFKRSNQIRYEGAIHEKINHRYHSLRLFKAFEEVKVIHTGYTQETRQGKSERNLKLLLEEYKKKPNDSDLCFYIAEAYYAGMDFEKCIEYANKVLVYNNSTLLGLNEKNYINILNSMIALNTPKEKLGLKIKEAIESFPDFPDFYFYLGDYYKRKDYYWDALDLYYKGIEKLEFGMNSQTSAYSNLTIIFDAIGHLCYKTNQIQESVKYFVESLKVNKYNSTSLEMLLHIFLKSEPIDEIINFLNKIFNYSDPKDVLFLFVIAIKLNNLVLAESFYNRIDKNQIGEQKERLANIKLIKGNYVDAFENLRQLYQDNSCESLALKCVLAALLSGEKNLLKDQCFDADKTIKYTLEGLENDTEQLLEDEKITLLKVFTLAIEISKVDLINLYSDFIYKHKIVQYVADIYYLYEYYKEALEMFEAYLKSEKNISLDMLRIIKFKMADSYFHVKDYEKSLSCLHEVLKLDPRDYKSYDLAIAISEKTADYQILKMMIENAKNNLPDSNYFRKLYQSILTNNSYSN